jgi:hypothetical protein
MREETMKTKVPNTNPKKKNRYPEQGILLPGIRAVREIRARLMKAQKEGAPEEELKKLRLELKTRKAAGKQGK